MKVLKAFNSVNRRFAVGQELTAADLTELDVDVLRERGCVGHKPETIVPTKSGSIPVTFAKRDED